MHARGQVCHADVEIGGWDQVRGRSLRSAEESAATRLRGILPSDLTVHRVSRAPAEFDARFSAVRRRYLYRICDDPASRDPLRRYDTVLVPRRLDVESMDRAARSLLGLHDWAAFCKRRAGATTVRTLLDHRWDRAPDGTVEATVVADAFCHSMVRSLVGAVVPVGRGDSRSTCRTRCCWAGCATPGCGSCRRTGCRSRRSATHWTTSSPPGPRSPGCVGCCPAERPSCLVPGFMVGRA